MLASSIPYKIPTRWADGATSTYVQSPIPVGSQPSGRASFTDGFPPIDFVPILSGGSPPWGKDHNGILQEVTDWLRWSQAGGAPVAYDGTFQTAIGGYPSGAIVMSIAFSGAAWLSIADNNTTNPDTGGANWVPWPNNYAISVSKQSDTSSGSFNLTTQVAGAFTYTTLQTTSFTFPSASPTGKYVLDVTSAVSFGAGVNVLGTPGKIMYAQVRQRVQDATGTPFDLIPIVGPLAVSDEVVGAGSEWVTSARAGNRNIGPHFSADTVANGTSGGPTDTTVRYAPGATISVVQSAAVANTGSNPTPSPSSVAGRLVLTASPG